MESVIVKIDDRKPTEFKVGDLYIGHNKTVILCTKSSAEDNNGEFEGVVVAADSDSIFYCAEYGRSWIKDSFVPFRGEIMLKQ
jgi:hypothetical protein